MLQNGSCGRQDKDLLIGGGCCHTVVTLSIKRGYWTPLRVEQLTPIQNASLYTGGFLLHRRLLKKTPACTPEY
jgi:hypothetical protein